MDRRRLLVRGRVQGVGFRYFTHREASALGLRGLVRNLPDGSVEVIVEGEPEQVEALLERVRQRPSGSRVESIDAAPHSGGELGPFRID